MVENSKELAENVIRLFKDDKLRLSLGHKAKTILESNRGAIKKHLQLIDEIFTSEKKIDSQ